MKRLLISLIAALSLRVEAAPHIAIHSVVQGFGRRACGQQNGGKG
jgi:hypothetical protein